MKKIKHTARDMRINGALSKYAPETYIPRFIRTSLKFWPDKRTPEEKVCDRFRYFVELVRSWGWTDAVNGYLHDSGGQWPDDHGSCPRCSEGYKGHFGTFTLPSEFFNICARLAETKHRLKREQESTA